MSMALVCTFYDKANYDSRMNQKNSSMVKYIDSYIMPFSPIQTKDYSLFKRKPDYEILKNYRYFEGSLLLVIIQILRERFAQKI